MPKKIETEDTDKIEDKVLDYCKDINYNKIPSCSYVKKAIKRFKSDLRNKSWDYYMDWEYVQKFYEFSKKLKLTNSKKYLDLLPWQLFIHANLLGWRYKNNKNKIRFRSGAVFVPRKNGKTTGIMYPLLLWDFLTTNSSESYFFEKDERQAEKMFKDLKTICKNSEGLSSIVSDTGTNIYYKNSKISYFSSETVGIDGYNPSIAIIDEYFCFNSDRPVTAMRFGSRARENGLVLIITTAGNDISLPAYDETEKIKKILNGVLIDDTYFGIIYGIDDKDDWKKPESYIKANPSIDTIIDRKILEQDLQDCLGQPSHQPDYKAKTLNVWTNDITNWIPIQKWDTEIRNQSININEFEGQLCYAGLDLSSISDFTVYTKCFKKDGLFYLYHKFYIPSEQIMEKYKVENINLLDWVNKGIVTAIDGPTINYDFIMKDILEDSEKFNIIELNYDNWNSNKLINDLENKIPKTTLIQSDQSLKKMNSPSKLFEKLIMEDKIIDPNPVMKWMVSNAVIKIDPNGNYKPLKEYKSSTKRIDGVITSIMTIDRANLNDEPVGTKDFDDVLKLFR
jgi:phage terminase large subunit-like protein